MEKRGITLARRGKGIPVIQTVFILSPEEDEDGFPIRNSIQLVVVVQVRLYGVNQAGVHLVHLIKDEH